MKTIYGPVASWRLGKSLGIDPICREEKICSFNCVYCQLGNKKPVIERKNFIEPIKLKKELNKVENIIEDIDIDVITLSGTGEPTLAKNIGKIIDLIKKRLNFPTAILTNSSYLSKKEVRKSLYKIDNVVATLDASSKKLFKEINKPHKEIKFEEYIDGIREFRDSYGGKFSLQTMFIEKNKEFAPKLSRIAKKLKPDEVQLNTPLRPPKAGPLEKKEMKLVKEEFSDLKNVKSVYKAKKPEVQPMNIEEVYKRKRSNI